MIEVKTYLNRKDARMVLEANGYVIETVKVTYDASSPYSHGSDSFHSPDWKEYEEEIAYKVGERPKWLDMKPLVGIDTSYTTDETVKRIINDKMMKLLCS